MLARLIVYSLFIYLYRGIWDACQAERASNPDSPFWMIALIAFLAIAGAAQVHVLIRLDRP